MEVNIRKIEKRDNKALAQMIRGVFIEHAAPQEGTVYTDPTTDHLYTLFQQPKSVLWVAEIDGEPLGCCGIYPTEGLPEQCVELVKFYIDKKARGLGIGKQLMDKSVTTAQNMGYRKIYIESLPAFEKAVNIYEKQGFKTLSNPLGNTGHSGCNIWMLKEL